MNNLTLLRKEKGLTQKDVADHLGISRQAYANYEAQNREPDINTLKSLSEFFGVTIDYILGNESSRSKTKGIKIPVYGKVAAGIPIEAITDIEDYEEIPEEMAISGVFFIFLQVAASPLTITTAISPFSMVFWMRTITTSPSIIRGSMLSPLILRAANSPEMAISSGISS